MTSNKAMYYVKLDDVKLNTVMVILHIENLL